MDNHNYFIKKGYKSYQTNNLKQHEIKENYWNEERIFMSNYYQYQVYSYGRDLIKRLGLKNTLDIGCGVATKLVNIISPICNSISGIDEQPAIKYCKENYKIGNFIVDNLENPSSNPGKFDLIICADVIEHLHNPDALLEFIIKCSHPETYILISTPERDILRGVDCMASDKPEHIREWNQKELKNYLEFMEFKILKQKTIPFIKIVLRKKVLDILYNTLISTNTIYTTQIVVCKTNKI